MRRRTPGMMAAVGAGQVHGLRQARFVHPGGSWPLYGCFLVGVLTIGSILGP